MMPYFSNHLRLGLLHTWRLLLLLLTKTGWDVMGYLCRCEARSGSPRASLSVAHLLQLLLADGTHPCKALVGDRQLTVAIAQLLLCCHCMLKDV